jgi:hypothetical protein
MHFLDHLAERRIAEAIERGELDGLPGEGRPLPPDEAAAAPLEVRTAYRLLKHAGFVPPEVACLREIGELESLVARSADGPERARAARRLQLLWERLAAGAPGAHVHLRRYRDQLLERLDKRESREGR